MRAVQAVHEGMPVTSVAEAYQVDRTTLHRWLARCRVTEDADKHLHCAKNSSGGITSRRSSQNTCGANAPGELRAILSHILDGAPSGPRCGRRVVRGRAH